MRNLNSSFRISFKHFERDCSFLTRPSMFLYLLYNLKCYNDNICVLSFHIVQIGRNVLKENTGEVLQKFRKVHAENLGWTK